MHSLIQTIASLYSIYTHVLYCPMFVALSVGRQWSWGRWSCYEKPRDDCETRCPWSWPHLSDHDIMNEWSWPLAVIYQWNRLQLELNALYGEMFRIASCLHWIMIYRQVFFPSFQQNPVEESISKKLASKFQPQHLEVINESSKHNVPKGKVSIDLQINNSISFPLWLVHVQWNTADHFNLLYPMHNIFDLSFCQSLVLFLSAQLLWNHATEFPETL